jgi:Xaa-Pro aminopeptidase
MSDWGRLAGSSPDNHGWEFPLDEYRRRVEALRRNMAARGIDCLFLTSEKNIRYVSGFHSQTWVSPTRSRFVLLPREGTPVAIAPNTNLPGFRATSWIEEVRGWAAPRPADDGVSLIIDALRTLVRPGGRIGAELGPEMRVEMPAADFARVREGLADRPFVDAGPILRPVRMVKSTHEISRVRQIGQIASESFARLEANLRPGLSERNVYALHHRLLVELGAEKVPYLVPVAGTDGYEQINMGPTDRVVASGDVLIIDVGATWRGYFCDFDRNFAFGRASAEIREAYARVYEATEAGLAAARPGRTAAEIWRAMADVLDPGGEAPTPVGRMGHGLGLDLTEPPSVAPGDETVLQEGMVITLEPSLVLPSGADGRRRLMVHEENVVITAEGAELLTRRAASTLPIVGM